MFMVFTEHWQFVILNIEARTKWSIFCKQHLRYIFLNETICVVIKISSQFVPKGRIASESALDRARAWCLGNK